MAQTGINADLNKNPYKNNNNNNNFISFYHINKNNNHHGTSYTEGNSTFTGASSSNINVKNNYYNINITTNNTICNINYNNNFNQTNTTENKSHEDQTDTKSINPSTSNQQKPTTPNCICFRTHILKDLQEQNIQIPEELLTPEKCCHQDTPIGCHYIFQESLFSYSPENRHRVFGIELSRLPSTLSSGLPIPKVLHEILNILSSKGDHKGIFRLSGSKLRIRALKEAIESSGSVPKDCRAVDLACILKQFLHQLPSPLLPPPILELLTRINSHTASTDRRCYLVFEACFLMPPLHLFTLKAILKYLKNVADRYEITHMTSSSLSICLLPSITRIQADESVFNTKRFKERVEVISFLINYHQHLGNIHLFKNIFSKFPSSNLSHIAFDAFQVKNYSEEEKKVSSKKFKRKSCSKKHKLNTTIVEDKENTILNKSFFNFSNHNTTFFKKSNLTSIFKKSHKHAKKDLQVPTNTTTLSNTNEHIDNNLDNNNTINVFNYTAPAFKSAAVKRKFDLFSGNMSIRASKKMKLLNVFGKQQKELSNETCYLPRKSKTNILKKIFEKMRKRKASALVTNEEDNPKLNKTNIFSKESTHQTNESTYSFSTSLLNNDKNFSLVSNAQNCSNITNTNISILDKYTFNYGQNNESHNYSFDFIRKNKNVLKNKKYNKMTNNKYKKHRKSHNHLLEKSFKSDTQKGLCDKYIDLVKKIDFDDHNSMDELGGFDDMQFNVTNNYYSDDNYYQKYNVGAVGESDDDEVYGMPRRIENILEEEEENILDKGMIELPALDEEYYDDTEEEDNEDDVKKNDLFNTATNKFEILGNESVIEKSNEISFKSCGRKRRKVGQRVYGIVDDNAFEVSNLSFKLSQGFYCKAENAEVCYGSSKKSVKNFSETNNESTYDFKKSFDAGTNDEEISNKADRNKLQEASVDLNEGERMHAGGSQWRTEDNEQSSKNDLEEFGNDPTEKDELCLNSNRLICHVSNHDQEHLNYIDKLVSQHENLNLGNNNFNNNIDSSSENHSNSLDSGLDILDTGNEVFKTPSSPSSSSSSPF